MDNPRPRPRSTTPHLDPDHRLERPLPPIPVSESISVPWNDAGAVSVARPSNPSSDQYHIDMRGIYDEDAGDGPDINLHGVDGSLLDIYPSRSNSSLSVTSHEMLTRAPYLEAVSNSSPRPSSIIDDYSTPQGGLPDLSSSHQREESGTPGISIPVSLREFLGDGSPTYRSGTSITARSGANDMTSTRVSRVQSREAQERTQDTAWRESGSESTTSVSVRTPTRTPTGTPTRSMRPGPEDDSSLPGSLRGASLLSHDSPSQVRHRLRPPPPSPDFVLPRWQPDAEVTFCPICRTQFSKFACPRLLYAALTNRVGFFVRKHHCRYAILTPLYFFCLFGVVML
jgi:FYVE zinc finger